MPVQSLEGNRSVERVAQMQPSRIRNKRWNAEEERGGEDARQRVLKSLAHLNRYAGFAGKLVRCSGWFAGSKYAGSTRF